MKDAIREHPQTIAMVLSLLMLLITLVIISFLGKDYNEGPVVIALAGAVSTLVGAIGGKAVSGTLVGDSPKSTIPDPPVMPEAPK